MRHFLTVVLQYPIYLYKGFTALLQSLCVLSISLLVKKKTKNKKQTF